VIASTPVYGTRLLAARGNLSWERRTQTTDLGYTDAGYCIDAPSYLPVGGAHNSGYGFPLVSVERREERS